MDVRIITTSYPRGLTLAFFKHFVNLHGGRDAFQGITTKQVCHFFVIPYTDATKLSLHWFTTFKTALTAIGNVVMVFSPWNSPTTLTRTWCVFEVFVAIECDARFEVAMGKTEKAIFLEHVKNDNDIMGNLVATPNTWPSSPLNNGQRASSKRESVLRGPV
ncbi:Aste57867_24284 [Aphanomyces stellatus]|uniref:Aste57867_24284 protein n=1 Tax=Aphanomyces stellatus TaxID=120398 RepID=A0A485LQ93_9STRA|nr:hypothetical protein As57867_024209 [Aphanomyces stellatus]VFU00924.1 Aste57867_24284 [Aphanomyces stellatus]